jgi:glycine cleavage system transcriptional repressor
MRTADLDFSSLFSPASLVRHGSAAAGRRQLQPVSTAAKSSQDLSDSRRQNADAKHRSAMNQWIVTAVGPDRPGLVGELTGHLHAGGANLLDSRMVNLRGQFALVLLMEAQPDGVLAERLPSIGESMGLRLFVTKQEPTSRPAKTGGVPFRLKTYSSDQPGIVHRVTDLLRTHGVNIEELETRQESAAFAGTPLFTMELHLTVPSDVPVRKLRADLEALCDQINCDVDLEPA